MVATVLGGLTGSFVCLHACAGLSPPAACARYMHGELGPNFPEQRPRPRVWKCAGITVDGEAAVDSMLGLGSEKSRRSGRHGRILHSRKAMSIVCAGCMTSLAPVLPSLSDRQHPP